MTRTRTALLLTLALATTPALAQQDVSTVNGSVSADAGQAYGDLETVNGSVSIAAGATVEDASTVYGSITVGDKAQAASLETVNGAIRIGKDVQVRKDVETVNRSIFTDRGTTIGGNVDTVNGAIGLVGTQLAGGIETVNGDITVGIGSHVRGGITVERPQSWFQSAPKRRPRVVISPGAVVAGPLRFEREVDLYVHRSARIGPVTGAEPVIFDTDTAPRD